jgi:hypothetical protein
MIASNIFLRQIGKTYMMRHMAEGNLWRCTFQGYVRSENSALGGEKLATRPGQPRPRFPYPGRGCWSLNALEPLAKSRGRFGVSLHLKAGVSHSRSNAQPSIHEQDIRRGVTPERRRGRHLLYGFEPRRLALYNNVSLGRHQTGTTKR